MLLPPSAILNHRGVDMFRVWRGSRGPSASLPDNGVATRGRDVLHAVAYKSGPSGRLGDGAVNFFRNARLRSLRASLLFRWRWKRALSPLTSDMVTQA